MFILLQVGSSIFSSQAHTSLTLLAIAVLSLVLRASGLLLLLLLLLPCRCLQLLSLRSFTVNRLAKALNRPEPMDQVPNSEGASGTQRPSMCREPSSALIDTDTSVACTALVRPCTFTARAHPAGCSLPCSSPGVAGLLPAGVEASQNAKQPRTDHRDAPQLGRLQLLPVCLVCTYACQHTCAGAGISTGMHRALVDSKRLGHRA